MSPKTERRLLRVWLLLCAITLVSWWLGSERGAPNAALASVVTYGALAITAVKVRVIVVEFMEARHAGGRLQLAMDAWLLLLLVGIAAIYTFKWQMPPV